MAILHFTSTGSGEALLILHGLFGSSRNWQSLARLFGANFRVINVDLRNHGQSFHDAEMNYAVMAEDVRRLLGELNIASCRLLGHSMGGKVAMTLACEFPELVDRLVVADIAPVAYDHDYDDLIEPILALPLDRLDNRAQVDELLSADIPEDQLRAFLLQNLVRHQDRWQWRVNWASIKANMRQLTAFDMANTDWQVDIPALFIRGGDSDYVGEAQVAVIDAHFRQPSMETLEAAGHWLHAEQPEAFSRRVTEFLLR